MRVKAKINNKAIQQLNNDMIIALIKTGYAIHDDLIHSQTMPLDTGELQNRNTFVDEKNSHKGKISIISDTKYARRLYLHPEYNFKRDKNPNAGGEWFNPYLDGKKKKFAQNSFNKFMRGKK